MAKLIKVIDNQTIELISYRNPNICFSIEDTTYIKDEGISGELKTNKFQDNEYFCDFKEQINPFELYSKNKEQEIEIKRLNEIIDELEKYIIDEYYIDDWEEKVLSQKDLINKLQELKKEGKE